MKISTPRRGDHRERRRVCLCFLIGISLTGIFWFQELRAADTKIGREEGELRIYIGGKEIGNEKYIIVTNENSASSTSILQFRNPVGGHEKIQLETKLDMDGRYVPRRYELKSDVNGQKGTITGTFTPNQAIFEYSPVSRKSGLMVGDKFTLLDTNIFHHFIFIARLYDFDGKGRTQQFEVAIPQEPDTGFLKITELKRESITVRRKKVDAHHLQADSGSLLVDLWIDDQRVLLKIAVKSRNLEVVRN